MGRQECGGADPGRACMALTARHFGPQVVGEKRAQRVLTKANKSDHMHTGEIVESSSIMGPYVTRLGLFSSLEPLHTSICPSKMCVTSWMCARDFDYLFFCTFNRYIFYYLLLFSSYPTHFLYFPLFNSSNYSTDLEKNKCDWLHLYIFSLRSTF